MNCGGDDLFCQGMTWLEHNEFIASTMAELVSRLGTKASGIIGAIAIFVEHNAQAIFGAGGLAFGIWRWWRYREQILHRRLAEYVRESDARLIDGQKYVLKALRRPGPCQPFEAPLFAPMQLRSVLREHNWDRSPVAMNVETSAETQLVRAVEKIRRQMETSRDEMKSLRQQFVTAQILLGAVSSSLARKSPARAHERNTLALESFRAALETEGHKHDRVAKELHAHQLRTSGHLNEALQAYCELEAIAGDLEDKEERVKLIARCKRFRAETLQMINATTDEAGKVTFAPCNPAYLLVSKTIVGSALSIMEELKPFSDWDLIEEGETSYLTAFISKNLNFPIVARQHLDRAEKAYETVLAISLPRRTWGWDKNRRLKFAARQGRDRVRDAKKGNYDSSWLTPPLKKPK